MASRESHELFVRQLKYDRLHHLMRIEWLESLPYLDSLNHTLLNQSRAHVARNGFGAGYNSVDLDDFEYIAELDAFEKSQQLAA
jgi:hypothetical protein